MPVGAAGEGGLVTRVLVEPGQWVRAGQVLATVDRSVQAQTAAQLAARERMAKCSLEWKEAKAGGKIEAGMKWPKYWSACNKRLKDGTKA